jgi:hypothetical protein
MFHFQIELLGGPADGWRTTSLVSPERTLKLETLGGEFQLAGDTDARLDALDRAPPSRRRAVYRFQCVTRLDSAGPCVALKYQFAGFDAVGQGRALAYNHSASPVAVVARRAMPVSVWRRILVATRSWLLAPVEHPCSVRAFE